jgi:hypothetical protein
MALTKPIGSVNITDTTEVTGIFVGNGTTVTADVSGTDFKTINGESMFGTGNIAVSGGGGEVVGVASSIDSEIALFSGTDGKTIKRSSNTGVLKATGGVVSNVISGTDVKTIGGVSILGSGDIAGVSGGVETFVATGTIPGAGFSVGLRSDGTVEVIDSTVVPEGSGTPGVFNSASTAYISVAALSSTQAIVTYTDQGNSSYGTTCILDISGSTITPGTPVVFESATSYYTNVEVLSSTKAIVCYDYNLSSGRCTVLDISGSTITPGPSYQIFTGGGVNCSVSALSSTQAILVYPDAGGDDYPRASVLTITGTAVAAGAELIISGGQTGTVEVTALSSTKAVAAFNSGNGNAFVIEISGTTATYGTIVSFSTAVSDSISLSTISSTQAILIYGNRTTLRGYACVLDVSGSTVTPATPVDFSGSEINTSSVATLSSTQAIATYTDAGNSLYGTSCVLDISGSTITPGTPVVFESATSWYTSVTDLSSTQAIVCYQDAGNLDYGTVVSSSPEHISTNALTTIGIAEAYATSGNPVDVTLIGGINDNQTGLTPGLIYYVDLDGTLTTTVTDYGKLGKAVSATEILIERNL